MSNLQYAPSVGYPQVGHCSSLKQSESQLGMRKWFLPVEFVKILYGPHLIDVDPWVLRDLLSMTSTSGSVMLERLNGGNVPTVQTGFSDLFPLS